MKVGSLFSGIGGLELGLEWAGVGETVWQVEQDEYCRRVLEKHWPNATRWDDVRTVGLHNLEAVDVICGGFPCQDISYAGKGAGLRGARSGLWFEFARIVREMGPEYVVVENVRALLVRGLDVVLGTLADSGYDAEWSCVSAQEMGAPHLRDRVFLIAALADALGGEHEPRRGRQPRRHGPPACGGNVADATLNGRRSRRTSDATQEPGGRQSHRSGIQPDVPHSLRERLEGQREIACGIGAELSDPCGNGWWHVEPDVGRVAHGVPARVDRLRALGNAVVPKVAEVVGRRLLQIDAGRRGVAA